MEDDEIEPSFWTKTDRHFTRGSEEHKYLIASLDIITQGFDDFSIVNTFEVWEHTSCKATTFTSYKEAFEYFMNVKDFEYEDKGIDI